MIIKTLYSGAEIYGMTEKNPTEIQDRKPPLVVVATLGPRGP